MQRNPNNGTLTPEQVEFYDTEGYLLLPEFLGLADLQGVIQAMSQKVDQIADELFRDGKIADKLESLPFKYRLARLFEGKTDKDFLQYGRSWRDRIPGYFDLMNNAKILGVMESLLGQEIFSNPIYNVRPKVPKVAAGAVPWHQDKSYWPDANANPVITVWIPIVDSTMENGCLHLIPRTHKKRVLSYHADQYTGTSYTEIDKNHLDELTVKRPILALPAKAGSLILFNDRLVHSSTPNNTDHVRWSVDLRYQPTDQDTMAGHGAGFFARSVQFPERVATLEDWLANRPENSGQLAGTAESAQK